MVMVSLGSGVKTRMVFRTAQAIKLMLDPAKDAMQYCIPREDVTANPSLFVEVGPCS
jgi:hypothetical protein